MQSLTRADFWNCEGLTNAGIAQLAHLRNLEEVTLDGLRGVTKDVLAVLPKHIRVNYI